MALGILTDIEVWAIAELIKLADDNGNPLFKNIEDNAGTFQQIATAEKCVDHWLGQIGIKDGGIASFGRYAPFAFVSTEILRTNREGGYEANIRIALDIVIGQQSEQHGICRIGDDTHIGTNRMFEKVVMAFDDVHPGEGFSNDPFYLTDTFENIVHPKMHGIQLRFEANWIPISE